MYIDCAKLDYLPEGSRDTLRRGQLEESEERGWTPKPFVIHKVLRKWVSRIFRLNQTRIKEKAVKIVAPPREENRIQK